MGPAGSLPSEDRLVLQQLLVVLDVAVILGAFVFAQPRAGPQHDRVVHDPRLGQHFRVFARDIVVDPVVIDPRISAT